MKKVNYNLIFEDMIKNNNYKCSNYVIERTKSIIKTEGLNDSLKIIEIGKSLFKNDLKNKNKRLRSYSLENIKEILNFLKETGYSKRKVAKIYDISVSTLSKWNKIFNINQI